MVKKKSKVEKVVEVESSEIRRLFLSQDDKIVAGVCGGIAEYLNVDSIWVRLVFLIALFMNGVGFFAYILFWVLIPENPKQKHYRTVAEEKVEEFSAKLKKEMKREERVEKVKKKVVRSESSRGSFIFGGVLILIGGMFLFERFFWTIDWKFVWPSLLILLGIYFIFKRD